MQINTNVSAQAPQAGTSARSTDADSPSTTTAPANPRSPTTSGGAHTGAATGTSPSGGSADSPAIQQLNAPMRGLRAQLAKTQEAIARERALVKDDPTGMASSAAMALSGEVATIESALQTATAELAQLLLASDEPTGTVNESA